MSNYQIENLELKLKWDIGNKELNLKRLHALSVKSGDTARIDTTIQKLYDLTNNKYYLYKALKKGKDWAYKVKLLEHLTEQNWRKARYYSKKLSNKELTEILNINLKPELLPAFIHDSANKVTYGGGTFINKYSIYLNTPDFMSYYYGILSVSENNFYNKLKLCDILMTRANTFKDSWALLLDLSSKVFMQSKDENNIIYETYIILYILRALKFYNLKEIKNETITVTVDQLKEIYIQSEITHHHANITGNHLAAFNKIYPELI